MKEASTTSLSEDQEEQCQQEGGGGRRASMLTLPISLIHDLCGFLWPMDIARFAATCQALGFREGNTSLVTQGLSYFRPSKTLSAHEVRHLILRNLPSLRGIRVLDLSSTELSPASLLHIGQLAANDGHLQTVKVLNLWDNSLGDEGAAALAQMLEMGGFKGLEGLYVRANQVGDDPALLMAFRTGVCTRLRSFSLAQNQLTVEGIRYLGPALATSYLRDIKKVDLHLNRLGDLGAEAVGEGIIASGGLPRLDELYLGYNDIADRGARAIADSIPFMPALQELDLAANRISNDGVIALAMRLSLSHPSGLTKGNGEADLVEEGGPTAVSPRLETIDLRQNRIGDGACALRDFLRPVEARQHGCPLLSAIYLDDNRAIRLRGKEALQELHAGTGIVWAYSEF